MLINNGVVSGSEILLSITWSTYSEVELLDHTVILFLIFEEPSEPEFYNKELQVQS
jgi:hypothetical protein